jgi:ferric-dicitrate binding protein FerR (iron transport regulator)
MDHEHLYLLIARKLANEATTDELRRLEEYLGADAEAEHAYSVISKLKERQQDNYRLRPGEEQDILERRLDKMRLFLNEETPDKKNKIKVVHRRWRWMAAASAAVLAVAGYFYLFAPVHRNKDIALAPRQAAPRVYVASQASSIVLQDGTKVWLNSGSTLRCSNTFNVSKREVSLSGEAFFDVAKDAARPFVVHVGRVMNVKVLGTRFNVKAYPGDPYVESSLVSGKVAVDVKDDPGREVILKPHQKFTVMAYDSASETATAQHTAPLSAPAYRITEISPNPVDHTLSETSWMEDKLSFNDITFEELAYDLQRIYHVKISFQGERLEKYHLTGVFRDEGLDEVLQALQVTTPFKYDIRGQQVIIY